LINGVREAGLEVALVEAAIITDGIKVTVVPGKPGERACDSVAVNDLDQWIAKHANETEGD